MNSTSSDAIEEALRVLLREEEGLERELNRVRTAISAIRPLTKSADAGIHPANRTRLTRQTTISMGGGAFRSPLVEQLSAAIDSWIAELNQPFTVGEISEFLKKRGVQLEEPRQLTDFLYRKSRKGYPLKRLDDGRYGIGELPAGQIEIPSE